MNNRTRWVLAAPVLLALSLPALLAQNAPDTGKKAYKIGDKVADFALKDEHGKTVKLSQYKGKVIVLNFFASW